MHHGSFTLKEGNVRLTDHVMIREEYFGGIVFNRNTGDIIEVDHEAYELLVWLQKIGAVEIHSISRNKKEHSIMPVLLSTDIIEYVPIVPILPNISDCLFSMIKKPSPDSPKQLFDTPQTLSAPETVHLAVTYQCSETCPDCYTRKYITTASRELDTAEMCDVVDILADNSVFQLAIGGGEPFKRSDLSDIVSHAANRGLAVHITTGQYILRPQWKNILRHIKSLHIGIRSEDLLYDAEDTSDKLRALVESVTNAGAGVGANIIVTRFTISHIDTLFELLISCGFRRFIFLRYKPISNRTRWDTENPGIEELTLFKDWLVQAKQRYPYVMLRIDCASAFLMKDIGISAARHAGISGCAAGERIIAVAPDGSVYPCSQLVGHAYNAGNLTKDTFRAIWRESDNLIKYRNFRQNESFVNSRCDSCEANSYCGGCRAFAKDTIGCEPRCPLEI